MEPILFGNTNICYYCGCPFRRKRNKDNRLYPNSRTLDHVVPKSLIPEQHPVMYVCACYRCNQEKKNLILADFANKLMTNYIQDKPFGKIKKRTIPIIVQNISALMSWIYTTNFA